MKTPIKGKAPAPATLAKTLFKLERRGEYEAAMAKLSGVWNDKTVLPDVSDYEPEDAAELLLRCGSIFGFLGNLKLLPGSQERSKDLLTGARFRFLEIGNTEKIAECENYISLAYWRTGEFNEAENWVEESLSHDLSNSNKTRLYSHLVKALINYSLKRHKENLEYLIAVEKYFLDSDDPYLNGDFHNRLGLVERSLGNTDRALRSYNLARHYYHKARNKSHEGMAANNVAWIYKELKEFALAHEAIDSAILLFRKAKEKVREACSLDTKASIYLDSGDYPEALKTIEKSISILKHCHNSDYLAEAYLTKSKAQIKFDDFPGGTLTLLDAMNIARVLLDEKMVQRLALEFEAVVNEKSAVRLIDKLEPVLKEKSGLPSSDAEKIRKEFDLALSFAGEDRKFVEQVYWELEKENISVFYDRSEETEIYLWGKNLATTLSDVYRLHSEYVVIFISEYYARKIWTKHEFQSVLAGALSEKPDYILPARFDDTEIPGLLPTTAFWDLRGETAKTFAKKIIRKLGKLRK